MLGRFLSRDPIGHAGGLNLYSYANSNPSTFADPTGLFTGAEAAAAARVFIAQMETMIASGSGAAAAGPNPLILGTLMTGVIGQYLIDNYVEDYYSRAPDVLASGRTFAYVNQGGDAVGHLDTAMRFKKLADAKGATFSEPCPGGSINTNASRFGHTFTRHGQNSLRFIMMRFADPKFSENEQGQFLDDQAAAAFILANWPHNKRKAYSVPISAGVPARIVLRDGSFDVATHVLIKPRPRGNGISSAFPIR
ncbi:MAG TPA: RHS repeat-associated core domain-containing protein [Phycisphaerales bacterium]|nr:RHS repeat-associated core domain-containing protein [Phycisphaerales bacterium]